MIVETNKLVKPTTYAKMKKVSAVYIYKLINQGKIRSIEIDGTKFIILD